MVKNGSKCFHNGQKPVKIDYFLPQKFKKWASMFSKCFHEHSEHQKSRLFKRLFDILYTIQTRRHHRSSQTVLFKFYNFPADILSLLHILFWLTDSLLPICCHSIIAVLKLFRNHYFEYTASFLERRYTQY